MKAFAQLFQALDATTAQSAKLAALVAYLRVAPPADAAWATYFLAGGKPRQMVPTKRLKALAQEAAGLPEWLFEESYQAVGDLAETIALLLPPPGDAHDLGLAAWVTDHLLPLRGMAPEALADTLCMQWARLAADERLVYFKLITGAFRVGVSRLQVTQALAAVSGVDAKRIAQRLMGYTHIGTQPTAASYQALIAPESEYERQQQGGQPYPFFLAHPLNPALHELPALLGHPNDWLAEWKWDGIRAQLVKRAGQVWLWSRGEERLDGRFPEIEQAAASLPDGCVLDGELLAWDDADNLPRAFTALQTRIQRRKPGAATLRNTPVRVLAYDLLERDGEDLRALPLQQRRVQLAEVVGALGDPRIQLSPEVDADDWQHAAQLREASRERGVEGLMLKRRDSVYQSGRRRGDWWKWKVEPLTIDAVLLYAQAGHGRRSTLYTDYTFGVWDGETLVPVAKAYSGLDDKEILALDRWIRAHTRERFGPVRSVSAEQVFELGFEAVNRSARHKSGIAVRFPRILRWRHDKPAAEADHLAQLQALAR